MPTARRRTKVMASIDPADLELAKQLAADLSGKLGVGVTIGEAIHRALVCLADSQRGGAWLTGEEAGRVMEERYRKAVQFVVEELLPHLGERLEAIGFVKDRPVAFVHIEGREPFGVGFPGLRTRPDDE